MALEVDLISFVAKHWGNWLGDVAADCVCSPIRSHGHVFSRRTLSVVRRDTAKLREVPVWCDKQTGHFLFYRDKVPLNHQEEDPRKYQG